MTMSVAIFNWIGTVADSPRWAYQGVRAVFDHYGVEPPSYETYLAEISYDFNGFCHGHRIPADNSWKTPVVIYEAYLARHLDDLALRDGIRELFTLLHARGIKIAVMSGVSMEEVFEGIEHLKISHLVTHVQRTILKREKDLHSVLDHFQTAAHDAIYVGSDIQGLRAAKEFGIKPVIAISGGFEQSARRLRESAHHLVATFDEILPWLEGDMYGAG
jgi:phosphoglycolate phosphatase-like HAD superfamily hydrolase